MNPSKSKALFRALLLAYILSGILLLALSFALYKLKLSEPQIGAAVYGVYLLSCLAGGFLAGKLLRQRRFFWGLLSGLLYFAILFLVSWLMKDSAFPSLNRLLTVMGCCVAGGCAGGMMS